MKICDNSIPWDPFMRKVPQGAAHRHFPLHDVSWETKVRAPLLLLSLLGLVALCLSALLAQVFLLPSLALSGSAFGLLIWLDNRADTSTRHRFQNLAAEMGFAYEPLDMHSIRRTTRSGREAWESFDPRLEPVFKTIPQLLLPRPGQMLPMDPRAQFWGYSKTGIPVWLLLGEMDSANQPGGAARQGRVFSLLAGYRFERDTGIRAMVLAAAPLGVGRKGIQTESTQFNQTFSISMDETEDAQSQQRLLQALTPATQTSLLDLWGGYRSQIIIDGETCFVRGDVVVDSADNAVLADRLSQAVESFLKAVVSFKQYAE
jgi:hypothetical protein